MTLVAGWPSERNRGRTEPATGSGTCWQTRGIRGQDRSTDRGIHAERRWHRKDLRQRLLMTSAGHPSRCLIGTFFFLLLIAMLKVWKSMVSFCFGNYIEQWPKVLRFTRIFIFTKSAVSVFMMAMCIYYRMLWRLIRWIAIAKQIPPLLFSPATKGSADIISVILSTQVRVLRMMRLKITFMLTE